MPIDIPKVVSDRWWKRTTQMSHLLLPLTVLLQVGCEGAVKERPVQTAEVLYETCIPCHGAQAEGRLLAKAPPLAGMPAWSSMHAPAGSP